MNYNVNIQFLQLMCLLRLIQCNQNLALFLDCLSIMTPSWVYFKVSVNTYGQRKTYGQYKRLDGQTERHRSFHIRYIIM